jgi:hypothetical protein
MCSVGVAAPTSPDVWQPAAKKVCDQIDQALEFYRQADLKNARLNAIMSYFKGYDAEIEPAIRITLGGQHVFAIEHQFRDFAKAMTPNPDKKHLETVNQLGLDLCKVMHEEAKILNAAHVSRQVFEVQ